MTVVALDVGGSTVRGALVNQAGTVVAEHTLGTGDRDPGLCAARQVAERLVGVAAERELAVRALGAGFPEYVDRDGRLTASEVLDWEEQPMTLLADLAPVVAVESDVRCGALGELHAPGSTLRDFAYISLGTGLSHTMVCDGVIRPGVRGEGIALGELPVHPDAGAGWSGSLESFASGAAIARRYADRTGASLPVGARSVVALASAGDQNAADVLTSAGSAIGYALAQLVWLLDPGVVVIGGGLGAADTLLHEAMRAQYGQLLVRRPNPPPIVTGALGATAGLLGAAHLAWSVVRSAEEPKT